MIPFQNHYYYYYYYYYYYLDAVTFMCQIKWCVGSLAVLRRMSQFGKAELAA